MNFFGVTKKYDFARGPMMPGVLLMALPLIGIALLNGIPSLVETVILGRWYGSTAIAGFGMANTVLAYITAFSAAVMVAANVVVARSCGKRDPKRVTASVNGAIIVSLVLGVMLTAVSLLFGKGLLRAMNTPEEVLEYSVTYFRFSSFGILFNTVYCGLIGSMYGMGDTVRPLLITVVKTVIRTVLTVVCIIVLRTGHIMTPLAGAFAELIGAVLALVCFIIGNGEAKLNLSAGIHGKSLLYVVVITLTAGLGTVGLNSANTFFTTMISVFGAYSVAAYSAANMVLGLVRWLPAALIPVILTVVAQCSGGDDAKKAFLNALITVVIAVVPAMFMALVVFIFGPAIGRIYVGYDDWQMLDMMSGMIRTMVFGEILYAATLALAAAIRARGAAVLSALASALPAVIAASVVAAEAENSYLADFAFGIAKFAIGIVPFICCVVTFVIVNVIAVALSKPAPAYGRAPVQQPVRPAMNFDPMTGRPLNQGGFVPKFDPMTGKPLQQDGQNGDNA